MEAVLLVLCIVGFVAVLFSPMLIVMGVMSLFKDRRKQKRERRDREYVMYLPPKNYRER